MSRTWRWTSDGNGSPSVFLPGVDAVFEEHRYPARIHESSDATGMLERANRIGFFSPRIPRRALSIGRRADRLLLLRQRHRRRWASRIGAT